MARRHQNATKRDGKLAKHVKDTVSCLSYGTTVSDSGQSDSASAVGSASEAGPSVGSSDVPGKVMTPVKSAQLYSCLEFENPQAEDTMCDVDWDSRSPITMTQAARYSKQSVDITDLVKSHAEQRELPSNTPPLLGLWLGNENDDHDEAPRYQKQKQKISRRKRGSRAAVSSKDLFLKLASVMEKTPKDGSPEPVSPDKKSLRLRRLSCKSPSHVGSVAASQKPVPLRASQVSERSFDLFEDTQPHSSIHHQRQTLLESTWKQAARSSFQSPERRSAVPCPLHSSPILQADYNSTTPKRPLQALSRKPSPLVTDKLNTSVEDLWTDEELFDDDSFIIKVTQVELNGASCTPKRPAKRKETASTPESASSKKSGRYNFSHKVPVTTASGKYALDPLRQNLSAVLEDTEDTTNVNAEVKSTTVPKTTNPPKTKPGDRPVTSSGLSQLNPYTLIVSNKTNTSRTEKGELFAKPLPVQVTHKQQPRTNSGLQAHSTNNYPGKSTASIPTKGSSHCDVNSARSSVNSNTQSLRSNTTVVTNKFIPKVTVPPSTKKLRSNGNSWSNTSTGCSLPGTKGPPGPSGNVQSPPTSKANSSLKLSPVLAASDGESGELVDVSLTDDILASLADPDDILDSQLALAAEELMDSQGLRDKFADRPGPGKHAVIMESSQLLPVATSCTNFGEKLKSNTANTTTTTDAFDEFGDNLMDDDSLSEPQVLAMLDMVESQASQEHTRNVGVIDQRDDKRSTDCSIVKNNNTGLKTTSSSGGTSNSTVAKIQTSSLQKMAHLKSTHSNKSSSNERDAQTSLPTTGPKRTTEPDVKLTTYPCQSPLSQAKLRTANFSFHRDRFYAANKGKIVPKDSDAYSVASPCKTGLIPNKTLSGVAKIVGPTCSPPGDTESLESAPMRSQTSSQKYSAAEIEKKKQEALKKRQNRLKLSKQTNRH